MLIIAFIHTHIYFCCRLRVFSAFMACSLLNRYPEASCKHWLSFGAPWWGREQNSNHYTERPLQSGLGYVVMCLTVHSKEAAEWRAEPQDLESWLLDMQMMPWILALLSTAVMYVCYSPNSQKRKASFPHEESCIFQNMFALFGMWN